jgi:hypothetical protein
MGRKSKTVAKQKCNKRVLVHLVPETDSKGKVTEPYKLLRVLIKEHHDCLTKAKIALVWRRGWKPDADGNLRMGQAKKASDCQKELRDFDFVILLNEAAWTEFTADQRLALLDHQLCHCQIRLDKNGESMEDERGRIVYRIRKHDVEEFSEIVARHGQWTPNMQHLVAQIKDREASGPMFHGDESKKAE